jgi:hypothetical protein
MRAWCEELVASWRQELQVAAEEEAREGGEVVVAEGRISTSR